MRTAAWYISNLSGPRRLATHRLGAGCRGPRSRAFESSQAGLCHDIPLLQTHQLNFSWQIVTMFFFSFLSCHLWKGYCSYWEFPPCGYTPQPGLMVHPEVGNLLTPVLELAIFSHGSRCMLTLKGDDTVSANNHKVLLEPSSLHFRDITLFTFPSNSLIETWLSFTPVPPRVLVPVFFWISFSLFHFSFSPPFWFSSTPFTTMETVSSIKSRIGSSL